MHLSNIDIDKQATSLLYPVQTSTSFHDYMQQHGLLWSNIAGVAGVSTLTVWSIDHKLAVSADHANKVRNALHIITGVPFTGSILVKR